MSKVELIILKKKKKKTKNRTPTTLVAKVRKQVFISYFRKHVSTGVPRA